ncbi:ThiF family adenylyltransferase [Sorangium sp. So ce590]|uniref:HesA/MoeB/ThiF family protein n=1 Tax=Sorangium sp. So ce590 TaxID=3133317 RepID=UPI003F60491F
METSALPRKKSTLVVHEIEGTLYFCSSGYATSIQDPSGEIAHLFAVMDGRRTLDEIHALLSARYPHVTRASLAKIIETLDQIGLLENASFGPEGLLDAYELARWDRNLKFFNAYSGLSTSRYELQHRLKTAKIALLGLGGLGSHILYDLAAMGAQDVSAVDFDRIDISNLNRQILYGEPDIGRSKVEVARERISAFSSRLRFEAREVRLSSTEDVLEIIRGRDYVICVADRPTTEIMTWVNEACVRERATLITGGLDTQRAIYYSVIPGVTGCIRCWSMEVQRRDPVSHRLLEEQRRIRGTRDDATFVTLISVLAGHMLTELVRLITGIAPPVGAGRLMEMHFDTMNVQVGEQWSRADSCPVCGGVCPGAELASEPYTSAA